MDKLILLQKIEIGAIQTGGGLFYPRSNRYAETMVKIRWTRKAIEDIHAIREFFKDHSEKYVEQLTEKIFEKTGYLEQYQRWAEKSQS
jgi:hypothetical protein